MKTCDVSITGQDMVFGVCARLVHLHLLGWVFFDEAARCALYAALDYTLWLSVLNGTYIFKNHVNHGGWRIANQDGEMFVIGT